MDWLQFISAIIGHVAWPIVILVVIVSVRRHLGSLAERILELSFGGATVKFDKLLSKGAEIIEHAPVSQQSELPLPPPTKTDKPVFPPRSGQERTGASSLLVSFDTVETILDRIGKAMNSKERGLSLIGALIEREVVPEDISELYTTLKAARDAVVHGERHTIKSSSERIYSAIPLYDRGIEHRFREGHGFQSASLNALWRFAINQNYKTQTKTTLKSLRPKKAGAFLGQIFRQRPATIFRAVTAPRAHTSNPYRPKAIFNPVSARQRCATDRFDMDFKTMNNDENNRALAELDEVLNGIQSDHPEADDDELFRHMLRFVSSGGNVHYQALCIRYACHGALESWIARRREESKR